MESVYQLLDEKEQQIELLRATIEAGEKSGYVKNFDPVKHLEELNRKYKQSVEKASRKQ